MPVAAVKKLSYKGWDDYKAEIDYFIKSQQFETEKDSIIYARSFCHAVALNLWKNTNNRKKLECRSYEADLVGLNPEALLLAHSISEFLASLNIMESSYLLGNLYTLFLPDSFRSKNGIYYTPPALAERLLDLLAAEGADWSNAEILDPACGGGAFLITVANRVMGDYRIKNLSSAERIAHLEQHLAGFELDEFAAWLTQVLLDILVYKDTIASGKRMQKVIVTCDTIQHALHEEKRYDIIVGNPPYGRVKLDEKTRAQYARSLYGHANLYGLFIDASLRMKKANGLLGFVTPTSFLGGKYFSNLRNFIIHKAPPLSIDFIAVRTGVFDQVLQETCLVTFGANQAKSVTTNKIDLTDKAYNVERIGSFQVAEGTAPWVIAREPAEADIVNAVTKIKTTLSDYGYKVSTGQLVWNRHKEQISEKCSKNSKPIIWAESITNSGKFNFEYKYRKTRKYIVLKDKQDFLLLNKSVLLVQRTTAKEQIRRLRSCVLPQSFISEWQGVVVENHVNIIYPIQDNPKISLEALSLVLNSKTVDSIFRCLSGSVAVSASELHAIPLPPIELLEGIEDIAHNQDEQYNVSNQVERLIENAYGLGVQ